MTHTFTRMVARPMWLACLVATAGCTLTDQSAPPLSGPSALGLSVVLVAEPDRLTQDGVSTTRITATVRDHENRPPEPSEVSSLEWNVIASDGRTFVEPSQQFTPIDSNGRASVVITAPSAPSAIPQTPVSLTVTATPVGKNSANAFARQVSVRLVPPAGTLPQNENPVARFTITPTTAMVGQTVTVDASQTTDEGVICGDACTYAWDFGDGGTDGGRVETHAYAAAGTYNIRLTVTDARGGVHVTSTPITITAPTAPVAVITVSPTSGTTAVARNFDGSASTVGAGATITSYSWNFGDGTSATGATPPAKTFAAVGSYVVRLTITDSLGRTATTTVTVTVS
jgi:PKD repeat protein